MHNVAVTVKDFNDLSLKELYEILRVRCEVFLLEQNIVCQDLDRVDYVSRHYYIEDDGEIIAYLRAYKTDEGVQIGRVLTLKRGVGLGRRIMEYAMDDIKKNFCHKTMLLHSQTHAIGFYQKLGFNVVSDVFDEEGVPHVTMIKEVK